MEQDDPAVTNVTVEREHGLVVDFADGRSCRFELLELRLNCPCAKCRNERDQGQTPWPTASSPTPLAVRDAELVGAWGLGITWNDGHATGIYPWELLRRWCETGQPALDADSGLGVEPLD